MNKHYFTSALELKSLNEKGEFTGYGSVFGNIDSYGDVVVKGAFRNFLSANSPGSVKLLWQHNPENPIGVYDEIREDDTGLFVKGRLLVDDVQKAREAYALLKNGALSGLSIGYSVNQDGAKYGDDGVRYLKDLKLFEISIVTFPANSSANVNGIKSANQIKTIRDFERLLRDVGYSQQQAKAIASDGFKAIHQCDVDEIDTEILTAVKQLSQILKTEVKHDC